MALDDKFTNFGETLDLVIRGCGRKAIGGAIGLVSGIYLVNIANEHIQALKDSSELTQYLVYGASILLLGYIGTVAGSSIKRKH